MKKEYEVVAAIIIKNGKYFCAKRGSKGEVGEMWEFPGGKIEPGEEPENAIVREIQEELNALIKVNKHFGSVHYEYQTFIINLHCYLCDLLEGELILSEHIDSKWLRKEELLSLHWAPADEVIVKRIINCTE